MTLIFLLFIPLAAGLLCLTTRSPAWWERLNLLAFALLVPLAMKLGADVLNHETVSALDGFLRADALSALVAGLTVPDHPAIDVGAIRRAQVFHHQAIGAGFDLSMATRDFLARNRDIAILLTPDRC